MSVLVIAPHPDDEVLGAGGTLLRYKCEGRLIAWLIVTGMSQKLGWSAERIARREAEIASVAEFFNFNEVYNLHLPTTKLDTLPMSELVQKMSDVIKSFKPSEILIPHSGDVHTDHQVVHNAALCCTKWFRYPFLKRVLSYETISETNFGLDNSRKFCPNVYVEISDFLSRKISAMEIYSDEMSEFPFPRSKLSIESLARYRGSSSGFDAAEAFQLLLERL